MPYGDVILRSFAIPWRHKYLWLIALFSGESGGNIRFNYTPSAYGTPNLTALQGQASGWVNDHSELTATLAAVFVLGLIAFFILGAVCEGATIRATAEHDADRPFGLRLAWAMGVHTAWVIVRFRLLLLTLYLPVLLFGVAWVAGVLVALVHQDIAMLLSVLFGGLFLFIVFLVYALYLLLLDRFGSRAVILEESNAIPAIRRANRLLSKRFGRSLLVLVLSLAIAFAFSVALGLVSFLAFLPVLLSANLTLSVLIVTAVVAIPIYVVVGGFLGAQSSTYWTLAFRRLDVEYPPAPPP